MLRAGKKALFYHFHQLFQGQQVHLHLIPLVIIGQLCCGFGSYSMLTLCYTLLADFCSEQLRSRAVVIINSVWGFSTFMLGVYYLMQLPWQFYLLLRILLPLLLIRFGFYMLIVQSPYILFNQNKRQEAWLSLATIAITNNRKENIPAIRKIIYQQERKDESNEASYKNVVKIVKQWRYLKPIILLSVIYGIVNLNFYGINFAFDAQSLGYGYNSLIAGFVEIASNAYLNFIINKIPRKKGIMVSYNIAGILGLGFLFAGVRNSLGLSIVFLALMKLVGTKGYTIVACFQVESFTVEIQSTAIGFIEALSLYGVFFAPLIVDLSSKIGIDPIAFVSIFLNFAIWLTYFMRETLMKSKKGLLNSLLQNEKENTTQSQNFYQSKQTMITDEKQQSSTSEQSKNLSQ